MNYFIFYFHANYFSTLSSLSSLILDCHEEIIESLLVMLPNRLRDPSFFFTIVLVCCSEYMSAEECSLQKLLYKARGACRSAN